MAAEAAALLDQLMGTTRNAVPGEEMKDTQWWDPEVCKHFLCGFCPSQLFTNTRSDIGHCEKRHDERFKFAYEESGEKGTRGYEEDFLQYLEKIIRELDRRITRGKERLKKSADAKRKVMEGDAGFNNEKLKTLTKEINRTINDLEELGAMGKVEEAQVLMKQVEELEKERDKEKNNLMYAGSRKLAGFEVDAHDFHEKMELCDVCCSFLVIGDSQTRVDAHLLGKQHLGYARIRSTITELRKSIEEKRKKLELERSMERDLKRITRSRSKEHERRRSHRSSSRERRRRRSRSHSRERRRRRSREREKRKRSHSRERKQSRSGSREKERRRRSRSRERKRSRSRERGRKRSRSHSRERKSRRRSHRSHSRSKEDSSRKSKSTDCNKESASKDSTSNGKEGGTSNATSSEKTAAAIEEESQEEGELVVEEGW